MAKAKKIDFSDYADGVAEPMWRVASDWHILEGKPRPVGVFARGGLHWIELSVDPAREWIMDHPKGLGKYDTEYDTGAYFDAIAATVREVLVKSSRTARQVRIAVHLVSADRVALDYE